MCVCRYANSKHIELKIIGIVKLLARWERWSAFFKTCDQYFIRNFYNQRQSHISKTIYQSGAGSWIKYIAFRLPVSRCPIEIVRITSTIWTFHFFFLFQPHRHPQFSKKKNLSISRQLFFIIIIISPLRSAWWPLYLQNWLLIFTRNCQHFSNFILLISSKKWMEKEMPIRCRSINFKMAALSMLWFIGDFVILFTLWCWFQVFFFFFYSKQINEIFFAK